MLERTPTMPFGACRESKFNISDEELRPYFSLPNVLDGLFGVRTFAAHPV